MTVTICIVERIHYLYCGLWILKCNPFKCLILVKLFLPIYSVKLMLDGLLYVAFLTKSVYDRHFHLFI